ncbi:unnamed protein product [Durusdinium trenchii]|uniref:ANK_REP_REGION domain-containing protein n=2 Tax=Durusdinium trenchii TaxID=1381693 RepID=A0ABP0LLN5_9DINO
MPRKEDRKQDKQKTWLEEYYENPGFGSPGGPVSNLTDQEMIDHVEMLVEHLTDDDPKKRIKAAEAMSAYIAEDAFLPEKMEVHPAQVLATLFFKGVPDRMACISAARCLAIMGRKAAPYASAALTKVLQNSGSDLRYEALVALGYLGPEAAPEAATAVANRVTNDEDARLRRQALLTLAVFGPDAAAASGLAIAKACHDEDTDVQVSAMKCMKAMGPDMDGAIAGPALTKVLASGSQEMRRFAMETIAVIGKGVAACSKSVAEHLKPLPGSDPELRWLAVLALEAMGPEIVYEQELLLSRAIKDPEPKVGEQAFLTLRDAGCIKGMMGSMYLEERIFSPEVLQATKFVTENSDSDNSDSDSGSDSDEVDAFGSSNGSEEEASEEEENNEEKEEREEEERKEEERLRRKLMASWN